MDSVHTAALDQTINHYLGMRRYERVIELVKQGLKENPERGRYYYLWGVCCFKLDHYEEAEEHLVTALEYGFDQEAIYSMLGHLYTETERWVEAEKAYLDALRENPNNAIVHAEYALLLKKTGHHAKADQLMEAALRLDPEDEDVIRCHHFWGLANDDRAEQIRAIEKLVQLSSDEASMEIQLGLNALYRNKTKSAREHFRQAFLLEPTNHKLAGLLQDLDHANHSLLVPLRFVNRIGGAWVMYVVGLGSIIAARAMGWNEVSKWLMIVYASFVVYSWIASPLVKLLNKTRG